MKHIKTYKLFESINRRNVTNEFDINCNSDFIDISDLNEILLDLCEEYDLVYRLQPSSQAFSILLKQPDSDKAIPILNYMQDRNDGKTIDLSIIKEIDDRLGDFGITIKKGGSYTLSNSIYFFFIVVYKKDEIVKESKEYSIIEVKKDIEDILLELNDENYTTSVYCETS